MDHQRKAPIGILGFPTAPFDASGKIDTYALSQNIEFLLKEGLQAIFVACGSGEFHSLSKSEYQSMVETAVFATGGKVPIYTGVGGNIMHALELADISRKGGADGYLLLPPYLIEGEQEGIFAYIKTIVESTDLNAILYQRDNCIFTLPTLQRLTEFPQIVGLKDGYGNMELNIELTQTIGDRLGWLNGMPFAEVTMPAYHALGFKSYSSAISNYLPHISRMFYDALIHNDQKLVRELYQQVILPINRVRRQRKGYAISLIKAGMQIVGLPVGNTVRPPVIPVEKEHYRQLEAIIKETLERYPAKHNGLPSGGRAV